MPSWAAPRGSAVRASLDVGSGEAASMDGTYGRAGAATAGQAPESPFGQATAQVGVTPVRACARPPDALE